VTAVVCVSAACAAPGIPHPGEVKRLRGRTTVVGRTRAGADATGSYGGEPDPGEPSGRGETERRVVACTRTISGCLSPDS